MAYESDEEQIEALKRWWNENGSSLLTGVAIVLAVFFGSRYWQASQLSEKEVASDTYQAIVEQVALGQGAGMTEEVRTGIESSYDQLRNDFPDSIYTRYAALMLASVYVADENYDQAAAELNWVLENPDIGFMMSAADELFLSTRLRLARVRLAQGQAQEALSLVTAVEPGTLAAGYAEVQGDAYAQLDQPAQARSAYQRAISLGPDNANFIQLKLQNLEG